MTPVNLWDALRIIGFADVIDIIVVGSVLYFLLLWFKRTKSAFVARGIFIFVVLYFIARLSGMYLTTWIFQGFFAISLIAIVVIFQEELRSIFERLAVWSLRRNSHPLQPAEVEILVRTLSRLAHEKIGALIVLKGADPLERHIEGGWELDAKMSEPLLQSLFNRHSEAHDGAVIIAEGRVARFAAHLPLSKEFDKLAGYGTRHAAALGLSEKADALCLVVSEEKGTINLAESGMLQKMRTPQSIEHKISSFLKEKSLPSSPKIQNPFFISNVKEKAASLLFALILWLTFVQGFKPASRVFQIPVEFKGLSKAMEVQSVRPNRIRVSLAGRKRELDLIDSSELRISVNLENATAGIERVYISEANLQIPPSLRLVHAMPPYFDVQLARRAGGALKSF